MKRFALPILALFVCLLAPFASAEEVQSSHGSEITANAVQEPCSNSLDVFVGSDEPIATPAEARAAAGGGGGAGPARAFLPPAGTEACSGCFQSCQSKWFACRTACGGNSLCRKQCDVEFSVCSCNCGCCV